MTEWSSDSVHASVTWVYLSNATFVVTGAIFWFYLAHVLPSSELGTVVILAAIAALASVIFPFGLGTGFQHFLSYYIGRARSPVLRPIVHGSQVAALILSLSALSISALLAPELSLLFFRTDSYAPAIELLAFFIGFNTAGRILQSVLLGLQRFTAYSAVTGLGYILSYGLAVLFLELSPGLAAIILGWTVGSAVGTVLAVVSIWYYSRRSAAAQVFANARAERTRFLRRLLRYSVPLFLSLVVTAGTNYVDRLILAVLTTLSNVAVYNYAILIATGSLYVVAPFITVLIPKFSELFGRGDPRALRALVRRANTLIVLVYVPIGLALAALSPVVLRILAGPAFESASFPLAMLVVISAVFVPYSNLICLGTGIQRSPDVFGATVLALVANISLCFLLVPTLGMIGAAIGNSSLTWVTLIVLYFRLHHTGFIQFDLRSLGAIWVASWWMFAVIWSPLFLLGYPSQLVLPFLLLGAGTLLLGLRYLRAISDETASLLCRVIPPRLGFFKTIVRWVAVIRP